ncbi:hypothetical protein K4F52_000099 [Lecanicillium sp. MT-2017a]|nr:hypothetical protein K4F52_000099 [Lecanicillium sp. MT-2017a]
MYFIIVAVIWAAACFGEALKPEQVGKRMAHLNEVGGEGFAQLPYNNPYYEESHNGGYRHGPWTQAELKYNAGEAVPVIKRGLVEGNADLQQINKNYGKYKPSETRMLCFYYDGYLVKMGTLFNRFMDPYKAVLDVLIPPVEEELQAWQKNTKKLSENLGSKWNCKKVSDDTMKLSQKVDEMLASVVR